jgi:RNA polymerase primary sigma factor
VSLDNSETNIESPSSSESSLKLELDHKSHQQVVSSILTMLETGDSAKDQKRQVFILESYFGLNGKEDCTLEQISEKLGITKERVRQLKEKSLSWLRDKLKELKLDYDIVFESVRY